ncbi:hypothetical protein I8752_31780 [Nostocaceae cyanobacterium CENA369]|uniref:Uncharacterized protein n=1 Tax=Dendronalium phyllosphericum CENA369 TaxID=1725256 RepID=A0A8J7LJ70_9NOST|nr:hypothetical protein [Dendronalium phyllosphericum CENA369]
MIYGNAPMMIFILATGYLFTVYLLLALAKRTTQKAVPRNFPAPSQEKHQQKLAVTPKVSEVVNSQ